MASELIRRSSALLLTLILVTGHAVHGAQAAQMTATMAAAVVLDATMPDGCDGCGPEGMSAQACALFCSGFLAVLPTALNLEPASAVIEHPAPALGGIGLHGPPDPFPPKSPLRFEASRPGCA